MKVPRYLVILAEPDPALRDLLAKILEGVHCEVAECSSAPELGAELLRASDANVDQLLLVSTTLLASSCTDQIRRVSRARYEQRQPPLRVLFTCELGDLERPLPDLGAGQPLDTLEKPFDISTFEDLVRSSLFSGAFVLPPCSSPLYETSGRDRQSSRPE